MATTSPVRTLSEALLEGKTAAGEARGLLEKDVLKRMALSGDAVIDAAVINAGMPDDAAQSAAKKARKRNGDLDFSAGGANAAFNLINDKRIQRNKSGTLSLTGTEEVEASPAEPARPPVPESGGLEQAAHSALGYAALVPIVADIALPGAGWVFGKLGMQGVRNTLNAPKDWMQKTHISKNVNLRQAANDGLMIGFTALQTYGVAKGFSQNMAALKEMYTDITGKEAPSTMAMLTAEMPPLLVETRNHFIQEYGLRGALQVVSWGLMARDLMRGKLKPAKEIEAGRIGLIAGILPGVVGMGVDMMMGQAATEVYSGFKKAIDSGQEVDANAYAAFIVATNADLAKRKLGRRVAVEIGEEYAKAHVHPSEILREMNDGRFNARVEKLIARDESELAKQQDKAQADAPRNLTMVEKVTGAKKQPDRPKLGHFTGMLAEKGNASGQEITGP